MVTSIKCVVWIAASAFVVAACADQPAVTVYNQNFGLVRERIQLELHEGENQLTFSDIAAHVEPDSVILRDPAGKHALRVLEQNYRNDPLTQDLLLSLFEGKRIEFQIGDKTVPGKIVRSGYVPHRAAWQQYGQEYMYSQMAYSGSWGGSGVPIIEIDGALRFGVPGVPLFPNLADDTVLKPTLEWVLSTDIAGKLDCELSYVTGGMSWKADYNVLSASEGDELELVGWVTIDNQCGRTFENARIKLMAGDVSKVQERIGGYRRSSYLMSGTADQMQPPVSEKAFDEYHLYTLNRATTLRDRETKQVEFIRAAGIQSRKAYVYDGVLIDWERYRGWDPYSLRVNREFGAQANSKVWVVCEFENTEANQLGMPLPAGRMRFYRGDEDGRHEFTGENEIDHTPKDEAVRVYTGNAFDLRGEHVRTQFEVSNQQDWLDETFEIKVRNHKDKPVTVRIMEHLYRWSNWEIVEKTHDFEKRNSQTIEFPIEVPANGETSVRYKVHYTW